MPLVRNRQRKTADCVYKKKWLLIVLIGVAIYGCATKTRVPIVNPPTVPAAAKLKSVAVYPFEGRNGKIYRAEIEALLASVTVQQKPYFKIVESSKLDSILQAQKKAGQPIYDAATVAKVGRLVGAKGVYMGTVTSEVVNDSRYSQSMQQCAYKDKDGKCKQWRSVSIPCTKRTARVAFTIRLVNMETGVQAYNRKVSGEAISGACKNDRNTLTDRETALGQARQTAYNRIRKDIAPYAVNLCIELMDDRDGISSKHAEQKLESGLAFAEGGRIDRACSLWQEARSEAPDSIALLYNIGLCAEAEGEFDNALALYQQADQLLLKPNPLINKALDRIQKRLNNKPVTSECGKSFLDTLESLTNPMNK